MRYEYEMNMGLDLRAQHGYQWWAQEAQQRWRFLFNYILVAYLCILVRVRMVTGLVKQNEK